jgi:hypothetical protein
MYCTEIRAARKAVSHTRVRTTILRAAHRHVKHSSAVGAAAGEFADYIPDEAFGVTEEH